MQCCTDFLVYSIENFDQEFRKCDEYTNHAASVQVANVVHCIEGRKRHSMVTTLTCPLHATMTA